MNDRNNTSRNLRRRNRAVFIVLVVFIAIVYAVTMVKIRLTGSPG